MNIRLKLRKKLQPRRTRIEGTGRGPTLRERVAARRLEFWLWFWAAMCSAGFLFALVRMGR